MPTRFDKCLYLTTYLVRGSHLYVFTNHLLSFEYFQWLCSYIFYPVAFIIGIEVNQCRQIAKVIGLKVLTTEVYSYQRLGQLYDDGLIDVCYSILVYKYTIVITYCYSSCIIIAIVVVVVVSINYCHSCCDIISVSIICCHNTYIIIIIIIIISVNATCCHSSCGIISASITSFCIAL